MAETTGAPLIAASKVTGTNVYDVAGDKIGSVYDIMLDKVSGRALYAVMSFGGLLGLGAKYHPLPWDILKYNERLGGYEINIGKSRLETAPSFDSEFTWTPRNQSEIDSYYNVQR
jgi:hypothetical protein